MRSSIPLAVLLACALVAGCGDRGDVEDDTPKPPKPRVSEAEKLARVAALPAPYDTADLENGRRKYALCRSCHVLDDDGPRMTGPHLEELFGREAGGEDDDYRYSEALAKSGITWDAASLDSWIENPRAMVPGNKMAFAGIKSPQDRIDIIGYLMAEAGEED